MNCDGYIETDGERIPYAIVRSSRRTLAVSVGRDGSVTVRAPHHVGRGSIGRLVAGKSRWVAATRARVLERASACPPPLDRAAMAEARTMLAGRLAACWDRFAPDGEAPPPLVVREMRSRWGSLSPAGRVCLNARLLHAPAECVDYVVFHELCHLRVRGHGADFYEELARYVPGWRALRRRLRDLPL